MNKEEFIQDYIANRLSDAEKTRAEVLLKTDAELQELYEMHLDLTAAFKISNDKALKKRLQALDDADEMAEPTTVPKNTNFGMLRRIAIAAIFIVGVFIAVNQFTARGDVFETYFEVCPNTYLPVTRGIAKQHSSFEAFKAYESANYAAAATAFEQILKTENNPNIRFYYAMSLLNQEKFELALNELNKLTSEIFDYQAESLWYAALIHLKNKNTETVKNQLEQLQQLNPTYKSAEIQKILQELQ